MWTFSCNVNIKIYRLKNYQKKDHPIQKDLIKLIEDLSQYKLEHIGIDGCTLPNPLMPLKKFALAAAHLADHTIN